MTLSEFHAACSKHDWYYEQGNFNRWQKGRAAHMKLRNEAQGDSVKLALFCAWTQWAYSGELWGTPKRPMPALGDYLLKTSTFDGSVPDIHPQQLSLAI